MTSRAPVAQTSVRELIATTAGALGSAPEARWIVAHVLGVGAGALSAMLDDAVPAPTAAAARAMVVRRRAGEPLQYVLGTWAFRTLELSVDRRVLIPRPETEQLVEVALEELSFHAGQDTSSPGLVAVDLGSGSGAIALSLAAEGATGGRSLEVWATDVSGAALEVLRANLAATAADRPEVAGRVQVAEGSWFAALPPRLAGGVHLVVSNPPYVSEPEWVALDPEVRDHEPVGALVPGRTGLEAIEAILVEARHWLVPGGSLVVELAPGQAVRVVERARVLGYTAPEVRRDLAARARVLVARRPADPARP